MNKKSQGMFSNLTLILILLIVSSVAGLLAGIIYYDMAVVQSTLQTVDFAIPIQDNSSIGTTNVTHFQDILEIVVYPILNLKSSLPYLTYFLIFGLVIAFGISSYLSSKNPVFFVYHILFLLLMTYFCFIISNAYIDLLSNPFINQMMINFTIYNKLMIYLPQVVFFTGLMFGAISFINLIKPQNQQINYGGGY